MISSCFESLLNRNLGEMPYSNLFNITYKKIVSQQIESQLPVLIGEW